MVPGERHLARAGEVEVVGGQVVDLVGVLAEEPGAGHDLGPDERRRDQRHEAVLRARGRAPGSSARARAGRRCRGGSRSASRTPSRRARCRWRRASRRGRRGRAARSRRSGVVPTSRSVTKFVLAARGHAVDARRSAMRADGRVEGAPRPRSTAACASFTAAASCLGLRDERGLLVLRRLGDGLAEGVLLGAERLRTRRWRRGGRRRRRRRRRRATRSRPAHAAIALMTSGSSRSSWGSITASILGDGP